MELKKHADTIIIMGGILASFLWMQSKFSSLEKDMTIVKTVLITKNYVQPDIFASTKEEIK